MSKSISTIIAIIFLITILSLPIMVFAQEGSILGNLDKAAGEEGAGYDTTIDKQTGFATVMGGLVRTFISLLGIIFIIYTIYGGFLWMTAAGNDEQVTKAKSIIRNGIIGLFVILSSAAIYFFISNALIGPGGLQPRGAVTNN